MWRPFIIRIAFCTCLFTDCYIAIKSREKKRRMRTIVIVVGKQRLYLCVVFPDFFLLAYMRRKWIFVAYKFQHTNAPMTSSNPLERRKKNCFNVVDIVSKLHVNNAMTIEQTFTVLSIKKMRNFIRLHWGFIVVWGVNVIIYWAINRWVYHICI